jgi:hypothetical protein
MPINDPANVTVSTLHGTHLTIGAAIQTALRALPANTQVFDISIIRRSTGNNCTAVITVETA